MRVFIDTNIYLNFFRTLSESNSEKINSLKVLRSNLKKNNIELIFPNVSQNEFYKNLPIEKDRYIASIKSTRLEMPAYPIVSRDPKQKNRIKEIKKELETEKKKIIRNYLKNADSTTREDIEFLINNAANIHEDDSIIERANKRRLLGYPPGKSKMEHHIGDEVVWEMLLAKCSGDDLTIVSGDNDWRELDFNNEQSKPKIKEFLKREWTKSSRKKLHFYATLGEYINDNLELQEKDKIPKQEITEEQTLNRQTNLITSTLTPITPYPAGGYTTTSSPTITFGTSPSYNGIGGMSGISGSVGSLTAASTSPSAIGTRICLFCGAVISNLNQYCPFCQSFS